jgi:hypothetical protein
MRKPEPGVQTIKRSFSVRDESGGMEEAFQHRPEVEEDSTQSKLYLPRLPNALIVARYNPHLQPSL